MVSENSTFLECADSIREAICMVCDVTGYKIENGKPLRAQLYTLLDYFSASYYKEETESVGILGYAQEDTHYILPRNWIKNTVDIGFEGAEWPVPIGYHKILTAYYGDYMKPVRSAGMAHNYPYYASQEAKLREEYKKRGLSFPKSFE